MNLRFRSSSRLLFAVVVAGTTSRAMSATNCTNNIAGYQVVTKHGGNTLIYDLSPADDNNLYLGTSDNCALNIIAQTQICPGSTIQCVKLQLGKNVVRKELVIPYTLYGDTVQTTSGSGQFHFGTPPYYGRQILKATTYTDTKCSKGGSGTTLSIPVVVIGGNVLTFRFFDVTTAKQIQLLYAASGANDAGTHTVCFPPSGGQQVNIQVDVDKCVRRLHLKLTGKNGTNTNSTASIAKSATGAPFFWYGNDVVDGSGVVGFQIGTKYTIRTTPNGDTSKHRATTFKFIDCPSTPPS